MGEEGKKWRSSDAEEVAEVMTALSETLPKLVRDTIAAVISEDAGRRLGKAVGSFYKELVEAGIDPDEALKMAKDYMASLTSLSEIFPELLGKQKLKLKIGRKPEVEEVEEGEEEGTEEE